RTSADTGLQGANFAFTRGNKTRRSTTTPNIEQRREQPGRRVHSEFVISNPDAVQADNTFDLVRTGRGHEKDIYRPSRHVCCTTTLRRKVNLHPDTDEKRRLRVLIIRSGLQ
ncbi:MAG: hypothetical protein EZS28_048162, partial [Streblomastix strix]